MTSTGYHDTGEEWAQKWNYRQDNINRNGSVSIGLYNDGTDSLSDSNDVGDITTEPSDGNYSRQTVSLDGGDVTLTQDGSGNLQAEFTVTFDVTNTTGSVDAWFAVVTFTSDIVGTDTGATDHLLTTVALDGGSRNIGENDQVDLTGRITLN